MLATDCYSRWWWSTLPLGVASTWRTGLVNTVRGNGGRRRLAGQGGAALVEFALIFPIFMTVVLGMFSGGTAYNQKNALVSASREGARYGATFPIASSSNAAISGWLHDVALYVENVSEGNLKSGVPGWQVCVAYVYTPTSGPDETKSERHFDTGGPSGVQPGKCYEDGRPASERRVQVATRRNGSIDALFFEYSLTLTSSTVTRFEAVP